MDILKGAVRSSLFVGLLLACLPGMASERKQATFEDGLKMLQSGQPQEAREVFDQLLETLAFGAGDPDESRRSFGSLLLYRAVAEFELNLPVDARWSWHSALALRPDLATADLSPLGRAAAFLVANRPRELELGVTVKYLEKLGRESPKEERPELDKGVQPQFPEYLRRSRLEGKVNLIVRIRENGGLDSPHFEGQSSHPAFEYAVLDALRSAGGKPALRNGVPSEEWFAIETYFRLR